MQNIPNDPNYVELTSFYAKRTNNVGRHSLYENIAELLSKKYLSMFR